MKKTITIIIAGFFCFLGTTQITVTSSLNTKSTPCLANAF